MPKNLKRGQLGSFNVFYKPKTSKKCKGYPLIKFENFRKKLHSAEKKPKGGPFGLTCTFGSIKKFMVKCECYSENEFANECSELSNCIL